MSPHAPDRHAEDGPGTGPRPGTQQGTDQGADHGTGFGTDHSTAYGTGHGAGREVRLRPGVAVTPLPGALHARGRRGQVTLEGSRALPALWKLLEPALRTGDRSAAAWQEDPDGPVRTALAALTGRLAAHDLLVTAPPGPPGPYDAASRWLADDCDDPAAAAAALASARPHVLAGDPGSGLAQAVVRSLARSVATPPALTVDPELPDGWVLLGAGPHAVAVGAGRTGATALVTPVGSAGRVREDAAALSRQPERAPDTSVGADADSVAAQGSSGTGGSPEAQRSGALTDLVAAAAVHRLLCAVVGAPDPAEEGEDPRVVAGRPAVLVGDASPPRAAYHSWAGGRRGPLPAADTLEEALRRAAAVCDERLGVLDAPLPGTLPQLPAALASCAVPGGTLLAAGVRVDLARLEAFCRAAELRLDASGSAVAVGATPGHAQGRALRRAAARMPVWHETALPGTLWARHEQARHWWTTLTVRQGVPARLTVQRAVAGTAFRATVRDGAGAPIGEAVEATAGDASAFATLGAVARAQCTAAGLHAQEVALPSGADADLANSEAKSAGWEGAGWPVRWFAALAGRERGLHSTLARLTGRAAPQRPVTPLADVLHAHGFTVAACPSAAPVAPQPAVEPPDVSAPPAAAVPPPAASPLPVAPTAPQPAVESPVSVRPDPSVPPAAAVPPPAASPTAVPPGPVDASPLPVPVVDAHTALLPGAPRTAVVRMDEWTLGLARELSRYAIGHDVRWAPVRVDGALVVVGPVLRPGAAACVACTAYQRLATAASRVPFRSPELALGGVVPPAFEDAVAALAAGLLAQTPENPETAADAAGPAPGTALVRVLHTVRGTWSTHAVRPFGGCPVCRPLPPDAAPDADSVPESAAAAAAEAALPPEPRPLPDPFVLRTPNSRTGREELRAALFDERFGPVRRLFRSEQAVLALSSAYVTDGRPVDSGGYGRAADFADSERIALFEAAERLAGMRPMGRATVLRAPYAALGPQRAVDPERLGLPDPAYHGHPAVRTVPYSPGLPLDWVRGWSLTRGRAVAVPEHVAYWDVPDPDHARVVYESSNGCGLGNSPQEAALYGLFEVAERDAFLMAWYAATPLRTIVPPADDELVAFLADRAELAGYRLTLLDATNDLGVPAVLALCRHRSRRTAAPRAFVAAGAHHDPRAAIRSAVVEVVTNVYEAAQRVHAPGRPRDPERLRPMLHAPDLVETLDDHVGVNTLPEAQPRFDALVADAPPLDWHRAWPGAPEPVADLAALLTATVTRLARTGLEVIAVRQDEPGIRDAFGLHCAKVVVPGTLPMTFGHVNHRTRGLPRLLEVPYRMGRAARPLRLDELAIHPHPFP